jgi:hypothetical protein
MRHLIPIMVLCIAAASAAAEEKTLYQGKLDSGGFGGPVIKYTEIKGQGAVMAGGRGGWIINHHVVLGGGGYGVASDVDAPQGTWHGGEPLDIEFGYGGFEVQYILNSDDVAHLTFYTLIGGGSVIYVSDYGHGSENHDHRSASDTVFVLEPALGSELNITKWFRLEGGLSYRIVSGVQQEELDNGDLSGVAGTLAFKFGKF